jgi:hypothetical protein
MNVVEENHPHTQTACDNFWYLVQQAVEAGQVGELSDHPITQAALQALADNADNTAE